MAVGLFFFLSAFGIIRGYQSKGNKYLGKIFISQRLTYYNKIIFFLGKICIGVYLILHYSSIVMQPFIYNEYLWVLTNAGFILLSAIVIYAGQYVIEKGIRSAILLTKTTKNTKTAGNNNGTD